MLNLPIYLRSNTYYLHTRIDGKQFKRSLKTPHKLTAIINASKILEKINIGGDMNRISKFEFNLNQGSFSSEGEDDHRRMMETLDKIATLRLINPTLSPQTPQRGVAPERGMRPVVAPQTLTLRALLKKYFLLQKPKREIPLPSCIFNNDFLAFVQARKKIEDNEQLFKYAPRAGKGAGNAVGKKFSRHLQELNIKREKLVFHSLRKFLNDHLMKSRVPIEPRCQFIGHELDNVNVATYSQKYGVDELADLVNNIQLDLLKLTKII